MTQTFVLRRHQDRLDAYRAVHAAEEGHIVTVKPPTRSNQQNALMWSILTEVSNAKPEGRLWVPETWKSAFMHLAGHQARFAEGLEGSGPFPLGYRTSHLTKAQMSDLLETIFAYGSSHGVRFADPAFAGEFA